MNYQQVIEHYGSAAAAGEAIGISRQAVSVWKESGEVPRLRQIEFEVQSNGALIADLPASLRRRRNLRRRSLVPA